MIRAAVKITAADQIIYIAGKDILFQCDGLFRVVLCLPVDIGENRNAAAFLFLYIMKKRGPGFTHPKDADVRMRLKNRLLVNRQYHLT